MTCARSACGFGVLNVATTAWPPETLSETTSVNDGSSTGRPLTRNRTLHMTVVPAAADEAMFAVSVNETGLPLLTVFEPASKPMLRPGSQETTCGVTAAGRLCSPLRIAADT